MWIRQTREKLGKFNCRHHWWHQIDVINVDDRKIWIKRIFYLTVADDFICEFVTNKGGSWSFLRSSKWEPLRQSHFAKVFRCFKVWNPNTSRSTFSSKVSKFANQNAFQTSKSAVQSISAFQRLENFFESKCFKFECFLSPFRSSSKRFGKPPATWHELKKAGTLLHSFRISKLKTLDMLPKASTI